MVRHWAIDSMRWEHTSQTLHMLHMLMSVVASFGGGHITMLPPGAFSPYGDTENHPQKGIITKENFGALKALGDMLVSGR